MKQTLLFIIILGSFKSYSQDSIKLKQIDSVVWMINHSKFEIKRDTLIQDHLEMKLSMRTYLTMIINGTELKKYENNVHGTTEENGVIKKLVSTNAFYFDHNKLIKVEEFATEGEKHLEMNWYYENDQPIYYSSKSEKAQERAELLLTIAKSILEKFKH